MNKLRVIMDHPSYMEIYLLFWQHNFLMELYISNSRRQPEGVKYLINYDKISRFPIIINVIDQIMAKV